MRNILYSIVAVAVLAASTSFAEVVRGAPDFTWLKSGNTSASLRSLRGQPVVLVVARSPRFRKFRAQVGQLQKVFQLLGNDKAVAVAAFTEEPGLIRSNIPFVLAANPAAVAAAYDVQGDFAVFVIGKDGNLDEISDRVLPGQRILDIINNSYVTQRDNRRAE